MKRLAENFFYGGQAVIEGVMMRGRKSLAIAVRKANGEIVTKEESISSITQRFPFLKWPLIRGSVALIEAMVIGIKALNYSASQFAEEEEEQLGAKEIALTLAMSLFLTVGLFIVLPAFVIRQIDAHVSSDVLLNAIEGGLKITFFIAYVAAISLMKDIRRVFQYHGAEHKAINCYEAGDPLTVEKVRSHSLIHKRCGTSFIIFVLMVSIFVFSFFGRPPFLLRVLCTCALSGRCRDLLRDHPVSGTKKEPLDHPSPFQAGHVDSAAHHARADDQQIEVAIRSLSVVLHRDSGASTDSPLAVP